MFITDLSSTKTQEGEDDYSRIEIDVDGAKFTLMHKLSLKGELIVSANSHLLYILPQAGNMVNLTCTSNIREVVTNHE